MKNRYLSTRIMAIMMAAAMVVSAAPAAFAAERADSETIKEDNQPAADADSDTQEDADAQDSADADKTADAEGTKTEYPLTITTYDYDGNEIETTYEKAPEKVLAVYQGSIETMLALGLEDRLVATAGLDNEVPDELKDAFSKTNYLDEFTPSLETVTMLEPDMILSWSSLFSDKNLGNVTDWIDKGCNTYYNTNTRPDGDRTLENEFTDILNIGKIFDVQDKAETIVDEAKNVIDTTLSATADMEEKPSVLIVEPLGEDITNYGASSLAGDMATQLGATLANPDAATVGKFCRERGVPFILDAAQAAGALPLIVQDLYVDMLAGNDYKWMLNYCGTGFVYIRKELRQSIQQKSAGWMSADDVSSADDLVLRQDAGRFELGFPNVSGIYGLGLVAERYCALGAQTIERYLAELRSYLCQQVELTSGLRLRYHFRQENQSQIVCLLADSTLHITDQQLWQRRAVCDLKGSDPQTGELILRVALHYYNTKEDIDRLILAIQGCRQGA